MLRIEVKFEKILQKINIFSGHNSKLTKLGLGKQTPRRLFSADESGRLMCWDMETKRITAPAWRDSDKCEICDQPFFWNLKDMWDRKVHIIQLKLFIIIFKIVGVRRHHCRTCGQSVCSSNNLNKNNY